MSGLPRIRVHPETSQWAIWTGRDDGYPWECREGEYVERLSDAMVSDWSVAAVVELPEPDGQVDAVDSNGEDVRTPYWLTNWGESVTAWIEGVETPAWELREDLDAIRADAAKMLAAIAACERFRTKRQGGERS